MSKILISSKSNRIELNENSVHFVRLLKEPTYNPNSIYLRGFIKEDNSTYIWGENSYGQIGNNTTKIENLPIKLSKNFNKMSGSDLLTAGIDDQGKIWSWGNNQYGKLGINSVTNMSTPCAIYGNHTFCDIICGTESCSAFDKDKQLWSWGNNYYYILGANGSYLVDKSTPVAVNMSDVVSYYGECDTFFCKVSIYSHALAISYVYDNFENPPILIGTETFAWGSGYSGCFGAGYNLLWDQPHNITSLYSSAEHHDFFEVAAGGGDSPFNQHSLAIDQFGKGWAFGQNNVGQLGTNSTICRCTPFAIYGDHTFCKIYAGRNNFSMATDNHGITWSWGYNGYGNLGINNKINKSTPIAMYGNHTFCQIVTAKNHVLAIDNNNKAWGWGYINNLGINLSTAMPSGSFDGVTHTFCKIFALGHSSFGIDNYGVSWAWGDNINYKLGDNSSINRSTPVIIHGNHTFCKIDGNDIYSISIDNHGKGWGWGDNSYGYIGIGSVDTIESTPVAIYGNHTFCQITSGFYHSSAIDNHGKGWGWGNNYDYQLSSSNYQSIESTPVAICGNHTFCQISSGFNTTVAIDNHGKGWGWGSNQRYQIGIQYFGTIYSPTEIHGNHTFCHIYVGYNCTLAIDNHGKGWGWGYNYLNGDAGVDIDADTSTPMEISGAPKTFCKIMSGNIFSMAIDNHGKAWSWGNNEKGQLGINEISVIFNQNDILYSPRRVCGDITFCDISLGYHHGLALDNHGRGWSWGQNYKLNNYSNKIYTWQMGRTIYITTPIFIS